MPQGGRFTGNEEIAMPGSKRTSSAPRRFAWARSVFAGFMIAAAPGGAPAESNNPIPDLSSAGFGWQTNVDDWQDPPPGHGHGPIGDDPAHPFTSSVKASRAGGQPTNRFGNFKDPVLKPWAAAQMQASNDEVLKGERAEPFAAQAQCYPGGVPGQLLFPFEPLYFIQTPKEVWMIWQRDHMVRRVYLTDRHSEPVRPSWFGESIGRYENGDTLVVDTVGLSTGNSYIDNFRTPHTAKLHVVERFTLEPGAKNLTAIATVDDPDTFNEPLTMKQRWFKANGSLEESICAENNHDYFHQNFFAVPTAEKPDF
jgi:hypothetical protein